MNNLQTTVSEVQPVPKVPPNLLLRSRMMAALSASPGGLNKEENTSKSEVTSSIASAFKVEQWTCRFTKLICHLFTLLILSTHYGPAKDKDWKVSVHQSPSEKYHFLHALKL